MNDSCGPGCDVAVGPSNTVTSLSNSHFLLRLLRDGMTARLWKGRLWSGRIKHQSEGRYRFWNSWSGLQFVMTFLSIETYFVLTYEVFCVAREKCN